MQVVRRAGAKLHLRVPAAKAVRECAVRIEGLEGDVAAIQAQERQEMELRRAEMQATKVSSSKGCLPRWATRKTGLVHAA
jgi:ATP-dependent RNA helicase DDX27